MKFAIYTLVGVMIVIAVAGLALSGSQPASTPKPAHARPRMVYVNLDKLVKKHPAWEAVSDMHAVMSSVKSGSVKVALQSPVSYGSKHNGVKLATEDASLRRDLVTKAITTADEAMLQLEAQQAEAVDLSLSQRREIMKRSSEAEVMAQAKEIERQTGDAVGQIAKKYSSDRINAELKVAALKNKVGKPGLDSKAVQSKLDSAEANLSNIKAELSTETDNAISDGRANIKNLWADASTRTEAAISIIESGEKRKIKNRSAASRYEILKDLLALYDSGNKAAVSAKKADLPVIPGARLSAVDQKNDSIGYWPSENMVLANRIREDTKLAVAKIAREEGVVVVFTRKTAGIPDATNQFAQLMDKSPWRVCNPILSQVSGS